MSSTAIDQLLQITAQTQPGRDSSQTSEADGDLFRSHLERAADAKEVKPPANGDDDLRAQVDEDEPLEAQTEQHETSTSQQEDTRATDESSEAVEQTEEAPAADEASDEVTLSAAAAAQVATESAEVTAIIEQAAIAVEAVATSTSDDQQQSNGQHTANVTEATDNANAATATSPVETEAELLTAETEGEASDATNESNSDSEGDQRPAKQKTTPATNSLPATSIGDGQTEGTDAIAQQPTTAQSQATITSAELNEGETTERSVQRTVSKPDVRSSVLSTPDTSAAIDTELTNTATNLNSSETNAAASTSTPSSGTETVAIADRSLGSVLAGKVASQSHSANSQEATETPTVDRARFVQRVGGAIRTAQQRDGQIQLRLSPPELGTLRIQLTVNEGAITAQLETETAAARTVLLDNLPALRERLAEQNITIEKFDVDVGREGQQQADNPSADEREANKSRAQTPKTTAQTNAQESTAAENDSHLMQPATDSGLDVRI